MCLAVVIRCVTHQPSPSSEILVLCLPPFFLIKAAIFALQCRERLEIERYLVESCAERKAAWCEDYLLTMRLVELPAQGYYAVLEWSGHVCK